MAGMVEVIGVGEVPKEPSTFGRIDPEVADVVEATIDPSLLVMGLDVGIPELELLVGIGLIEWLPITTIGLIADDPPVD